LSGNAERYAPQMLQQDSSSFVLFRSSSHTETRSKAADFLKKRGRKLGSRVLLSVASRIADDPFHKVKKMLQELLLRLMEEQNGEAEHKGWCDSELAVNEQTRQKKTAEVEMLHAEIDQLESLTAKLMAEISEMNAAIAALDEGMSKVTEIRRMEQAQNLDTIQDAKEAQTAVAQASSVLKDFYSRTVVLTQQPQTSGPLDVPYSGMQTETEGVVDILVVIGSDFATLEAETKAAEVTAQKEYDTLMTDSKMDRERKTMELNHKITQQQDSKQALTVKMNDIVGAQKELDVALGYFDKLKPSCVDSAVSYEDMVSRREAETHSLQEALQILSGQHVS